MSQIEMDDEAVQKNQRKVHNNINNNLAIGFIEDRARIQQENTQRKVSMEVEETDQDISKNIRQKLCSVRGDLICIRNSFNEKNINKSQKVRMKCLKQQICNNEEDIYQNSQIKILQDAHEFNMLNIKCIKQKIQQMSQFLDQFSQKNKILQKGIQKKINSFQCIFIESIKRNNDRLNLMQNQKYMPSYNQTEEPNKVEKQVQQSENEQLEQEQEQEQQESDQSEYQGSDYQQIKSTESRLKQQIQFFKISPIKKKKNKTNRSMAEQSQSQNQRQNSNKVSKKAKNKTKINKKENQTNISEAMPEAIQRCGLNKYFSIIKSKITFLKNLKKHNQIVLKYAMRYFFDTNGFKIRIIKSKNNDISIGIIDRGNTATQFTRAAIFYHGQSGEIRDKTIPTKMGEGFQQGNIIQVKLYLGQIRWIVNGNLRAQYKSLKLTHQYLTFHPIFQFHDENDIIQWLPI